MNVDGADNRDHYSGPLLTFTTESLEQFQLLSSQFTAVDGRTGGAAVTMVTKSGPNQLHGSAFGYERNEIDAEGLFRPADQRREASFQPAAFGGSVGGPIIRNRMFFFGALEQQLEDLNRFVPEQNYEQFEVLLRSDRAGTAPARARQSRSPPYRHTALRTADVFTQGHRTAEQRPLGLDALRRSERRARLGHLDLNNDDGQPDDFTIAAFSAVGQHNWVIGNAGLNQITVQANHVDYLADVGPGYWEALHERLPERGHPVGAAVLPDSHDRGRR